MLALQKWVVCEESGRWTAALRMAFARLPKARSTPRLYEVRSLGGLSTHLDKNGRDLTLIEVSRENLTEVVQLLMRRGPRLSQFVALLEEAAPRRHTAAAIHGEPGTQPIADLLWEAGAADVVESPRQLRGLLSLHNRLDTVRSPILGSFAERPSFSDWAWSTLPWQEP
jgi:hypothetical protein